MHFCRLAENSCRGLATGGVITGGFVIMRPDTVPLEAEKRMIDAPIASFSDAVPAIQLYS